MRKAKYFGSVLMFVGTLPPLQCLTETICSHYKMQNFKRFPAVSKLCSYVNSWRRYELCKLCYRPYFVPLWGQFYEFMNNCNRTPGHFHKILAHAQLDVIAVILRPLWAKSVNSIYTKCCNPISLHMDDLIRTIEGPKKRCALTVTTITRLYYNYATTLIFSEYRYIYS